MTVVATALLIFVLLLQLPVLLVVAELAIQTYPRWNTAESIGLHMWIEIVASNKYKHG